MMVKLRAENEFMLSYRCGKMNDTVTRGNTNGIVLPASSQQGSDHNFSWSRQGFAKITTPHLNLFAAELFVCLRLSKFPYSFFNIKNPYFLENLAKMSALKRLISVKCINSFQYRFKDDHLSRKTFFMVKVF